MKVAQLAVLGVAVVAAGGAAMMAMNLAQQPEPTPVAQVAEAPKIELERVLVAQGDIPIGFSIKEENLTWQDWPRTALNEAFLTEQANPEAMTKIVGAVVRSTIYAGEPIRESKLVRSDQGYLSAILPAGKRAIAVSISADTSAGGFILPNDRVDVIMTRRGEKRNEFLTETILVNVRVLAIDQTIEEIDGKKTVVGSTATLELTPQQSEILTVAQQMADRLTLALRSLEDSKEEDSDGAGHLLTGGKSRKDKGALRIIKFGTTTEVVPKG
ncbi:MAG: Flp pilus assembly protein CpaB [Pseudomonadota bacterium]